MKKLNKHHRRSHYYVYIKSTCVHLNIKTKFILVVRTKHVYQFDEESFFFISIFIGYLENIHTWIYVQKFMWEYAIR
jgi:hypothetical protein